MSEAAARSAVVELLKHIGENPLRSGLIDTPARFAKALREMTAGYAMNPADILARTFDGEDYNEVIVVPGIRFTSLCEHHVLPFVGTACVGYLPSRNRIVGLSKIPRLVECFARRLQVQERLTMQIANALNDALQPRGVAVIVRAQHMCMACRGVRQSDAAMVTSCLLGEARDNPTLRTELLSLMGK